MPPFSTFPAWSRDHPLEDVLNRLKESPEVAGVLLLGSTAQGLTEASDYDLLLAMHSGDAFGFECTFIDSRATDVVLLHHEELDRILSLSTWTQAGERDVLSWVAAARVAYSENDSLTDAPERARRIAADSTPIKDEEVYYRWVEANFNLTKSRRYLTSKSPEYTYSLEIRLAKALAELPQDYLAGHGRNWLGDKDAIEYLFEHDAPFAEMLIATIRSEAPIAERLETYANLMRRAFESVGESWADRETAGGWFRATGEPHERSRWESLAP